jgi:von Willebrand factor type A domain
MRGTTLRRGGATRLGDLPDLEAPAGRTTAARIALVLALAAALAGAIFLASSAGSGRAALLPEGVKTGVVVVDMSGSVSGVPFERVATVVRDFAAVNQAMGLVMFSDTAYELLPPNSPASTLLEFERFFDPQAVTGGGLSFGVTPWNQFSAGTRISAGLRMGRQALQRAHVTHGSLLLISDLNDSSADEEPLVAEALALKKSHIPVRIVPVLAAPADVRIFASLFGWNVFVSPSTYRTTATNNVQPIATSWPWALLAVGALLVGLLAANELFNTRLRPEAAA